MVDENMATAFAPEPVAATAPPAKHAAVEDMAMIRAAADLTRDLNTPRAAIYWPDFLLSAVLGYGGLAVAIAADNRALALTGAVLAVLALYRAALFIHELTHLRLSALPGFWTAWNAIIGVPLLVPSFMYEGLHNQHHSKLRYGTAEDPEYLPLALMKPWSIPAFVAISALGPIGLLLRYGVLGPLSLVIPPLRKLVWERYSGLVINPDYRRRPAEGSQRRWWIGLEIAVSLWAMALLAMLFTGIIPMRAFLIGLGIVSAVLVLNQVRTLVAHLWANDGEQMSVTAQFLDSVNVPPPGLLPALWAPVGLRYHALHHLLPGLPYHALGEAHRRLSAELAPESAYFRANYRSLPKLVLHLIRGSGKPAASA